MGSQGREEREAETRSDTVRNAQICGGRKLGNGQLKTEGLFGGRAASQERFLASISASYVQCHSTPYTGG